MRALLAGIFVSGSTLGVVGAIGSHYLDNQWPWWSGPAIGLTMLGSIVLSYLLFNRLGSKSRVSEKSPEQQIAELEAQGLLTTASYKAVRAFEVEEFEDEGLHYFIELAEGGVLYLNGQYLYDYEGAKDDPKMKRTFPCSEFVIKRHKLEGYVVDLICGGSVLPLDCEAPHIQEKDFERGLIPEDGEIIRDRSYEQIKSERLKADTWNC